MLVTIKRNTFSCFALLVSQLCSIWNHLVRLSTDHGRTVIITTHYIEEARQADTVSSQQIQGQIWNFPFHSILFLSPDWFDEIGSFAGGGIAAKSACDTRTSYVRRSFSQIKQNGAS